MAKKPIRIADVLGFGASAPRSMAGGLQREYRRMPRNAPIRGAITAKKPTATQELVQLLTPNTKFGNEFAAKLAPAIDMSPIGVLTGLVDARRAYQAGNTGQAAGLGLLAALGAVPGGKGAKAAKDAAETAMERGIIAYHGSPHSFDRFSLGSIGTGEGNQAYGHGLYFAEAEDVAKKYRDIQGRASRDPMMNVAYKQISSGQNPQEMLPMIFPNAGKNEIDAAIERAKNTKRGSMYEVRINANPEDFITWDELLDNQSQKVKDVLGSGGIISAADILSRAYRNPMYGGDLIKADMATPSQVSQGLLQRGIAGIKYKDALSRGKENPTNNYVVFDDALIEVLKKYGIAIPALAGGGLLATQPQQNGGI